MKTALEVIKEDVIVTSSERKVLSDKTSERGKRSSIFTSKHEEVEFAAYWSTRSKSEIALCRKTISQFYKIEKGYLKSFFLKWKNVYGKKEVREAGPLDVFEVLKSSTVGKRTEDELTCIKKFLVQNITAIPFKNVTKDEMTMICNKIKMVPQRGKSILFFQGDFGQVYYLIAQGSVGLFLISEKDRELQVANELKHLRGKPLVDPEALKLMGNHFITLSKGKGFGEMAILAETKKVRSCAAVTMDDNSLLLSMDADLYNAVMRKHHFRLTYTSKAVNIMNGSPFFGSIPTSTLSYLAFQMMHQSYTKNAIVAKQGDKVAEFYVVFKGEVAKKAPAAELERKGVSEPTLMQSVLLPGCIIGVEETLQGIKEYGATYVVNKTGTELFSLSSNVLRALFKDKKRSGDTSATLEILGRLSELSTEAQARTHRARKLSTMITSKNDQKEILMALLPKVTQLEGQEVNNEVNNESVVETPKKKVLEKKKFVSLVPKKKEELISVSPYNFITDPIGNGNKNESNRRNNSKLSQNNNNSAFSPKKPVMERSSKVAIVSPRREIPRKNFQ